MSKHNDDKTPQQKTLYCVECGMFNTGDGWREFPIRPLSLAYQFVNSEHVRKTHCIGCAVELELSQPQAWLNKDSDL